MSLRFSRIAAARMLALTILASPCAVWAQGPTSAAVAAPPPVIKPPVNLAAITLSPSQVDTLSRALAEAPSHGFAEHAFSPPGLDDMLRSADADTRRRGEIALKAAVLRYAAAVRRGRLVDANFDREWGMRPPPYDPAPEFQSAVSQNRLAAWLADLPPPYAGYQALQKGLVVYRAIAARGGWKTLPSGPALKPGAHDARVADLKDRLAAEDPAAAKAFSAQPSATPDLYDPAAVQAVMAFQRRHGLNADGVIDKSTLAALNAPASERVLQIIANMERWRWTPRDLPADRVQVNIAAAILTLFRDDQPVLSMRTAAGRPTDHTPILASQIHSVVFNPPWNVPASIATKELWPKERKHPGYLQREDIQIIKTANGGTRLQQQAGPKSALGQVKFDFNNPYGVYLHDTPTRSAFARESRLVSHGCVRVEKPKDLARLLLDADPAWTVSKIDDLIDTGDTKRAALPKPVAVLIFYWTAFAGPDGAMNFRADPYDWDRELLQRIAAGRPGDA